MKVKKTRTKKLSKKMCKCKTCIILNETIEVEVTVSAGREFQRDDVLGKKEFINFEV